MRIFPEMCASTSWPLSRATRNMALGSGSVTFPSRTIASSLGFGSGRPFRGASGDENLLIGAGGARTRGPFGPTDQVIGGGPRRQLRCQAPRSGEREDLGAVLGDGDGVLEVGAELAVGGDDRPPVGEDPGLGGADVDHGLDGEDVADPELGSSPGIAVVGH